MEPRRSDAAGQRTRMVKLWEIFAEGKFISLHNRPLASKIPRYTVIMKN
jgi:hypothetical protein